MEHYENIPFFRRKEFDAINGIDEVTRYAI
jgi:hypothetical protein